MLQGFMIHLSISLSLCTIQNSVVVDRPLLDEDREVEIWSWEESQILLLPYSVPKSI